MRRCYFGRDMDCTCRIFLRELGWWLRVSLVCLGFGSGRRVFVQAQTDCYFTHGALLETSLQAFVLFFFPPGTCFSVQARVGIQFTIITARRFSSDCANSRSRDFSDRKIHFHRDWNPLTSVGRGDKLSARLPDPACGFSRVYYL